MGTIGPRVDIVLRIMQIYQEVSPHYLYTFFVQNQLRFIKGSSLNNVMSLMTELH